MEKLVNMVFDRGVDGRLGNWRAINRSDHAIKFFMLTICVLFLDVEGDEGGGKIGGFVSYLNCKLFYKQGTSSRLDVKISRVYSIGALLAYGHQ
jgi:hypothetical protein